jgi:pimeloyl-ACP methyl ester carboxylesterase
VRAPHFDLSTLPRWYNGGSVLATHLTNGLNFVFPAGERFFIRSVRFYLDRVQDPALKAAAMAFVAERGLPHPWIVGWSFGTEVALKYGLQHPIDGAILLSPPLHRASAEEVAAWAGSGRRLVAIVPELDDYLRPAEAAERFASVPEIELVAVEGGKHLWVGEEQTYRVLSEIVARVNPGVLPLARTWNG